MDVYWAKTAQQTCANLQHTRCRPPSACHQKFERQAPFAQDSVAQKSRITFTKTVNEVFLPLDSHVSGEYQHSEWTVRSGSTKCTKCRSSKLAHGEESCWNHSKTRNSSVPISCGTVQLGLLALPVFLVTVAAKQAIQSSKNVTCLRRDAPATDGECWPRLLSRELEEGLIPWRKFRSLLLPQQRRRVRGRVVVVEFR